MPSLEERFNTLLQVEMLLDVTIENACKTGIDLGDDQEEFDQYVVGTLEDALERLKNIPCYVKYLKRRHNK